MTDGRWYNDSNMPPPGAELFRTERWMHLCEQTASHHQLLLRTSDRNEPPTRVDLLFKPVTAMRLRVDYRQGLVVRRATQGQQDAVLAEVPGVTLGESQVFVLESEGYQDFVISDAVGSHEGAEFGPSSLAPSVYPYTPPWAATELPFGASELAGNAASLGELVDALAAGDERAPEPDRYRYVYVVMVDLDGRYLPVAVYLTRAEAEGALRAEREANAEAVARADEAGPASEAWHLAMAVRQPRGRQPEDRQPRGRQPREKWIEMVPVGL